MGIFILKFKKDIIPHKKFTHIFYDEMYKNKNNGDFIIVFWKKKFEAILGLKSQPSTSS